MTWENKPHLWVRKRSTKILPLLLNSSQANGYHWSVTAKEGELERHNLNLWLIKNACVGKRLDRVVERNGEKQRSTTVLWNLKKGMPLTYSLRQGMATTCLLKYTSIQFTGPRTISYYFLCILSVFLLTQCTMQIHRTVAEIWIILGLCWGPLLRW